MHLKMVKMKKLVKVVNFVLCVSYHLMIKQLKNLKEKKNETLTQAQPFKRDNWLYLRLAQMVKNLPAIQET